MKKTVLLSVATAATLWAAPSEDLGAIDVNATAFETTVVESSSRTNIVTANRFSLLQRNDRTLSPPSTRRFYDSREEVLGKC